LFVETTKFNQILSLFAEHQINWAIEKIEDYLIQSNIFNKPEADVFGERERNQLNGLVLADKYNLEKLRNTVLRKIQNANMLASLKKHTDLSVHTKYLIVRKCVQQNPLEIKNGEFSDEGKLIIEFLDKYMR